MEVIRFKFSAIKQSRWYELLIRFVLGGLATLFAGAVAKLAGPSWGGLFLAFPAIFCASSTMIEKHERNRKESNHLKGIRRGQQAAALDAFGAGLGSVGMVAFALTVLFGRFLQPLFVLLFAMIAWSIVAISAWNFVKIRSRIHR
jgi:hypothetical protein